MYRVQRLLNTISILQVLWKTFAKLSALTKERILAAGDHALHGQRAGDGPGHARPRAGRLLRRARRPGLHPVLHQLLRHYQLLSVAEVWTNWSSIYNIHSTMLCQVGSVIGICLLRLIKTGIWYFSFQGAVSGKFHISTRSSEPIQNSGGSGNSSSRGSFERIFHRFPGQPLLWGCSFPDNLISMVYDWCNPEENPHWKKLIFIWSEPWNHVSTGQQPHLWKSREKINVIDILGDLKNNILNKVIFGN